MIVLDSGLGGISVVRALALLAPDVPLIYCADTAGFPYGNRTPEEIRARSTKLVKALTARYPDMSIVLACNTLSTLCLDHLRKLFTVPFVGTVPAIKTAAQRSISRRFTLLATANTASSQYTQDLIAEFARDCVVDAYGAPNLASMAERMLRGEGTDEAALRLELRPAFCDDVYGKTDCMVLGCTHYPLIQEALVKTAPWPVTWIDSSEAIARQALRVAGDAPAEAVAYVTDPASIDLYVPVFTREGFLRTEVLPIG